MNHILLVEDSPVFQALVKKTFSIPGYKVTTAASAKEALALIPKFDFSLIILDIGLPDQNGLELCSELKKNEKTQKLPIILLTGETDVAHKVTAFSLGADDFIVKPFHPLELQARVESKIKKSKESNDASTEGSVVKGSLQINFDSQSVIVVSDAGEKEVQITPREFKILRLLIKNEGRVLSRDQILEAAWGGDGSSVFDRTVDSHISSLRKKLGPAAAAYIESVKGAGYRLSVP